MTPRRIGILTGGGDCPGLNAVIRAATLALHSHCGAEVVGIERGFLGLITGEVQALTPARVSGIHSEGGTILGTHNRCDPFAWFGAAGADVSDRVMATARQLGLDALVVIGGDGTMTIAHKFEAFGLPMVGVPKTIDNDIAGTERSFGFDSAVAVVSDALDSLRTTARSHGRVMIVETMGRHAGWIALDGGLAGGADVILLPELPYDLAAVAAHCRAIVARQGHALVCVAEGAHARGRDASLLHGVNDAPGAVRLGGIGHALEAALQPLIDVEVRTTVLGHLQRGGTPTAFDRVLATRLGVHAAQLLERNEFGRLVVWRSGDCRSVPLSEVAGKMRTVPVDHPTVEAARGLGISLGQTAQAIG